MTTFRYSAKVAGSSLYDVSSIRSYKGAGAFAGGIMFDGRQLAPQESSAKGDSGDKGDKSDSIDMSVFINCNDRSQVCLLNISVYIRSMFSVKVSLN